MQPEVSYTCPQCGRTSYNPNDARHRFCGACNTFEDAFPRSLPRELLRVPTTPGRVITEMHAWIATHADGSEGIIGAVEREPDGSRRMLPLVASNRASLDSRRDQAEQAMLLSRGRGPAEVKRVDIVTFRRVADG